MHISNLYIIADTQKQTTLRLNKNKTNNPISSNNHPSATANIAKHCLKRGGIHNQREHHIILTKCEAVRPTFVSENNSSSGKPRILCNRVHAMGKDALETTKTILSKTTFCIVWWTLIWNKCPYFIVFSFQNICVMSRHVFLSQIMRLTMPTGMHDVTHEIAKEVFWLILIPWNTIRSLLFQNVGHFCLEH